MRTWLFIHKTLWEKWQWKWSANILVRGLGGNKDTRLFTGGLLLEMSTFYSLRRKETLQLWLAALVLYKNQSPIIEDVIALIGSTEYEELLGILDDFSKGKDTHTVISAERAAAQIRSYVLWRDKLNAEKW